MTGIFNQLSNKSEMIILTGNSYEFDQLSKQLLVNKSKFTLEHKINEELQHVKHLEYIQIEHFNNQLVKVSVTNDYLRIEGSLEKIKFLSQNLELEDGEILNNYHLHIEYYENHLYLSPKSIPLIIQYD